MRILVISIFLILAGCSSAGVKQPEKDQSKDISLNEYCVSNPCRENVTISLRTDEGEAYKQAGLYWPIIQGDRISILPGETVFIETELVDGKAVNLKSVSTIEKPESTFTFTFEQKDNDIGMTLSVKNPFSSIIKYHLDMLDFRGNPHQTSSCPVVPKGSVFEMWPHPIPEIVVSDIHVLTEEEGFSCVY